MSLLRDQASASAELEAFSRQARPEEARHCKRLGRATRFCQASVSSGARASGLRLCCCCRVVPGLLAAEAIRAFCIDFNWGPGGPNGFAPPGLWADADPEQHLAWYAGLGANVIQTFAVSCNGYAWYQGGKVPAATGAAP